MTRKIRNPLGRNFSSGESDKFLAWWQKFRPTNSFARWKFRPKKFRLIRHFIFPMRTHTSWHIFYFQLISILTNTFHVSDAYRSYHIWYFWRIPILPAIFYISDVFRYFLPYLIFPTHTDIPYLILYFWRIPIFPTKFYNSDAYRYFLLFYIIWTHTNTS